jgi:hypothetical protein
MPGIYIQRTNPQDSEHKRCPKKPAYLAGFFMSEHAYWKDYERNSGYRGNTNITGVPPLLLTTVLMKVGKRNLIHWLIV